MTLKCSGQRKLTQFMTNHIVGNKYLMEHFTVMDHKRKADELRDYRTSSSPGLDRLASTLGSLLVDLDEQLLINERPFF